MILCHVEIGEYCEFDDIKKKCNILKNVMSWELKEPGKGLYYRNNEYIFALYKSPEGPKMFYKNEIYVLHPDLNINVEKQEKTRHFSIKEYDIEIDYPTSVYIDWDAFSTEEDVDLFVLIANNYKNPEFYEVYTVKE